VVARIKILIIYYPCAVLFIDLFPLSRLRCHL